MRIHFFRAGTVVLLAVGLLALPAQAAPRSIELACPSEWSVTFEDVPSNNVHGPAIGCVAAWGVSQGTSEDAYSPYTSVTRAQMATFITKTILVSSGDLNPDADDAFDDDDGNPHELAINALADAGIVSGVTPRSYRPRATVTRAQMATFLVRAFEYVTATPLPTGPDAFRDDDGNTHEHAINKASQAGFTGGTTATSYSPKGLVRRDAMASFLARTLDKSVADGFMSPPLTGAAPPPPENAPPEGPPPPPEDAASQEYSSNSTTRQSASRGANVPGNMYKPYGKGPADLIGTRPFLYLGSGEPSGCFAWLPVLVNMNYGELTATELGEWQWGCANSGGSVPYWQSFEGLINDDWYFRAPTTGYWGIFNYGYDYRYGQYFGFGFSTIADNANWYMYFEPRLLHPNP